MNINTPQFCFITPTCLLEQYASQSSKHLCLAHLVDKDEVYAAFYNKMRMRGDYIIMDNSAFELEVPYSADKLLGLAEKCGANAIVLPDYPFRESIYTINMALKWGEIFKNKGFETVFVPQSLTGHITDWLRAYDFASTSPVVDIIGMSILGVPNAIPNIDRSFARVVMTALLQNQQRFSTKRHHYLGLNSGPGLELPSLIKMGALWSCDSSNPVWMAMLGHEYTTNTDSYLPVKKCTFPVDFDYDEKIDAHTHKLIQHNINVVKEIFNDNITK